MPTIVIQNLPPYTRGETDVVSLRWCIIGDSADGLAPLDANLELGPATEAASELTLIGSYRPPQPHDAPPPDRDLINTAARITSRAFLTSIADAVASDHPDFI